MKIVTIYDDKTHCLSTKAKRLPLTPAGLKEAHQIADQLITTLTPLMPAAGLAAPQIGISRQVFIYSWDRSMENMMIVINPKITEYGIETYYSWEACFSTVQENNTSQAVYVSRAKSIIVEFSNLEGHLIKQKLDGFAAKVFQHEYDHLHGLVDTEKENVELKSFDSQEVLLEFMKQVKKEDSLSYTKPVELAS